LDRIPGKEAQKILWVLQLLEEFEILPSNYFKKLTSTNDIWECRIKTGSNCYRVFSFFFRGNKVILTHGYAKKSQKTDPREIKRAERYKKEYCHRHGGVT